MRQSTVDQPVMVNTKNGESYDGILQGIDSFMNVKMSKVNITSASHKHSKDGED